MKKLFVNNIDLKEGKNAEKYKSFVQKNRDLRVEIKSLLCDERENTKRIDELKKSMSIYGISAKLSQTLEQELEKTKPRSNNQTKRELIKFRDYLLEENDKLLFVMNKKLI